MTNIVRQIIRTLVFVLTGVTGVFVYRDNFLERKNLDLRGLLSSVECREESFCSSNNLVVSPPKGKTFSGSFFLDEERINCLLPRKKKCIFIIRSSWYLIIKNRDFICKKTVAGIQISFKERNNKHLVLCIHDPMVSWGKNQHESNFWFDNVWLGNKKPFLNILYNIQYDLTRSNLIEVQNSIQLKRILWFIRNKIVSLYVGQKKQFFLTLSVRISDTQIPHDQDFRGNTRDNLYKSLMYKLSKLYRIMYTKFYRSFVFPRTLYPKKSNLESLRFFISPPRNFDPITADPKFYRESSSITDFLEILWKFYSYMNRSDSKVKNLHPYLSVNSNMECASNPCSEKSLRSGKKENWSLFHFRSKKKYVNKRRIKITLEKDVISVQIFEGDIQDNNNIYYYQCNIYKKYLPTILTTSGFKLIRSILCEIYFNLILPNLVSKIQDIFDIPWVILEKIILKWTRISEKILMKWTLISDK